MLRTKARAHTGQVHTTRPLSKPRDHSMITWGPEPVDPHVAHTTWSSVARVGAGTTLSSLTRSG